MKYIRKTTFGILLSIFLPLSITSAALNQFSDSVKIPSWGEFAIGALNHLEIFEGNSDGTFRPMDGINRAEFCKILTQATGADLYFPLTASFPDVESYDWFYPYVETAKREGWLEGYPDGTFRPGNKVNRAEASKILTRAFDIATAQHENSNQWFDRYVFALSDLSLLPYGRTVLNIAAEVTPSRVEIAEQMYRIMRYKGLISSDQIEEISEKFNIEAPSVEDPEGDTSSSPVYTGDPTPEEEVEALPQTVDPTAGDIYITKVAPANQSISANKSQSGISALTLTIYAQNGDAQIEALRFRRTGNGSADDFSEAWLESYGTAVSEKVDISAEIFTIPLKSPLELENASKNLTLKISTSATAQSGTSSRFVLNLPQWIQANTDSKIGFFPFGGVDIEIK